MQRGLLCHNRARQLDPASIADEDIQDRRRGKRVPQGRALHDHVNLYFNPRNPMMYRRKQLHSEICVLRVSPQVIDLPDVVISDQNASSDWARFAAAPEGLAIVQYDRTFAENWTDHADQRDVWRHKAQMCAEVLVPSVVPPDLIVGACVSCNDSRVRLTTAEFGLTIEEIPPLFFR